jgi:hypothetical protein
MRNPVVTPSLQKKEKTNQAACGNQDGPQGHLMDEGSGSRAFSSPHRGPRRRADASFSDYRRGADSNPGALILSCRCFGIMTDPDTIHARTEASSKSYCRAITDERLPASGPTAPKRGVPATAMLLLLLMRIQQKRVTVL